MAMKGSYNLCNLFTRFKPHILMFLTQVAYTILYLVTEASFNHGMNPNVYTTYRHLVSGIVMLPFAYVLERKQRPKLTLALFGEIFVLSLMGVSLTMNMYFESLNYTSSTFVSSVLNSTAALTFVIAVALRMEALNLWNVHGAAKVLGTVVSLVGATVMTLYRGPVIKNFLEALIHIPGGKAGENHQSWVKGSILAVASCICWALWFIMQASTLKRYPAQLSLTAWVSFLGAAQSAVYTAVVEHNKAAWTIGFNIDFWSTLYGGVIVSGVVVYVQMWCTEQKGPVFATMFNPLSTILVAVIAYFILGEILYLGSILGAVIVIIGLYMLLWGKEEDEQVETTLKDAELLVCAEQTESKIQTTTTPASPEEHKIIPAV